MSKAAEHILVFTAGFLLVACWELLSRRGR